jgi:ribulose-phosphate 3-epimerase
MILGSSKWNARLMQATMDLKIAASLISADFTRLSEEVQEVEKAGADLLHIDVYPLLVWGFEYRRLGNINIGPLLIEALRNRTKLPFDVHLAIEVSQDIVRKYAEAGCDVITVHAEACPDLEKTIGLIKEKGLKAGIALNPSTPLSLVKPYSEDLDLMLIMTTSANFGGLNLTPNVIPKIREAAVLRKGRGSPLDVEVDGGVDCLSAPELFEAGANILVAGGAIFKETDYADAIRNLRQACSRTARP